MAGTGSANIFYVVSDALSSLRENKGTTVLTSFTLGFSLAIFSLFAFVITNLNAVVKSWGDRTQVIAYVKNDPGSSPEAMKERILRMEGVMSADFTSKEKALNELRLELKGHEGILEGVDSNPLPASFEIRVHDEYIEPARLESVVKGIEAEAWVEEVQYSKEWAEKLASFLRFVKLVAAVTGAFLAAATLFIISNTIRLAVYARKDEIEIMKLVGASDMYVKAPFVIEGVVQGVLGGLLAMGILATGRAAIMGQVPAYLRFALEMPYPVPVFMVVLAASGIVMGVVGSLISMNRFLKV